MDVALDIEDSEALRVYLRASGHIGPSEVPEIQVLGGGVSNRTVLVRCPNGEAWVLKQALRKLRVAADWFADPERVHREAAGMRWLARVAPEGTIIPLVFEDRRHHVIAMQAAPEPHENWKTCLLRGEVSLDLVEQFAAMLAMIHTGSMNHLEEIQPELGKRDFFESLRLEPYYQYTAGQCPWAASFLNTLIRETRQHSDALVHGDYSPKNILVHNNALILLDHEVIHIGDPAFDLGFALTHFLSKALHLAEHRPKFLEAARVFVTTYEKNARQSAPQAMSRRVERHLMGCMLARIAGRSPLEYLDDEARKFQDRILQALLPTLGRGVSHLINQYEAHLNAPAVPFGT